MQGHNADHTPVNAGDDHGTEIADPAHGRFLPGTEVARRNDLFDALAILFEQRVVEIVFGQPAADRLGNEGLDHQRRNQGESVGHLEDDENAGDRSPDNGRQAAAHADNRQQDVGRRPKWDRQAEQPGCCDPGHGSEKQRGSKDAAAATEPVTDPGREQFAAKQNGGVPPKYPAIQRRRKIVISEAEDAGVSRGEEDSAPQQSYSQPTEQG